MTENLYGLVCINQLTGKVIVLLEDSTKELCNRELRFIDDKSASIIEYKLGEKLSDKIK